MLVTDKQTDKKKDRRTDAGENFISRPGGTRAITSKWKQEIMDTLSEGVKKESQMPYLVTNLGLYIY